MDKEATSQFFAQMRTQIKKTKMMVCQKSCREVKNLSKKIECWETAREESKDVEKLDKTIAKWIKRRDTRLEEYKLIKTADAFEVTCQALLKSRDHWQKVLENADESRHNKALARLASHNSIVTKVNEFKKLHTDWELWLPELIELWIGKRKLKANRLTAKKEFNSDKKKGDGKKKTKNKKIKSED